MLVEFISSDVILNLNCDVLPSITFNMHMESEQQVSKEFIIEFKAFRGNQDEFTIKELVILDLITNIP